MDPAPLENSSRSSSLTPAGAATNDAACVELRTPDSGLRTDSLGSERPSDSLSKLQRLEIYFYLRLTRAVEERLTVFYRQSKVVGGLYRSLGQEGESVASAYALDPADILAPLIRNLGSVLTRGIRPRDIFWQYMARAGSPTQGRDLNVHFTHLARPGTDEPTIIGPISMLGDLVPVLAGMGLAARLQRRPLVALTYIGDGGTSTGAFHEGMNFAAVERVPLIVIAEDNKYAYSTPTSKQMAIARIDERALAYGVAHEMVDGNDVLAVFDATRRAATRARAGGGPTLIGVDTMRMKGHAEHDDMRYVPNAMLEQWRARDPIARYQGALLDCSAASEQEIREMDEMVGALVEEEARLAEASPLPDPASGATGVYAGEVGPVPHLDLWPSPFKTRLAAVPAAGNRPAAGDPPQAIPAATTHETGS